MAESSIRYSYSFFDKFSIQSKASNSNDIILRSKDSNQLILMKQIQVNPDEYEETLATLEYEKRLSHQQLLSLVDYHPQPPHHKFIVLYQYCDITLMNQFQNRLKQCRHFQESELWSIFTSLIFGLAYLQEQNVGHGSISLHDCFINQQGFIKVCDPTAATSNPYNIIKGYYYSPEIMRCLVHETGQQINIFKNDVFSLGCCMLQLTLTKDITQIFNYQSGYIVKPSLNCLLQELQCLRLSPLYIRILKQTLELSLDSRKDFIGLKTQIFQMINQEPSQDSQKLRASIEIKSSISSMCRSKGQPNITIKQIYKTQISQEKSKQSGSKTNPMILTFSEIGMISQNGITQSKSSGRQMLSQFLKIQPNVDYLFGNLKKSVHLGKQQEELQPSTPIPAMITYNLQRQQIKDKEVGQMQERMKQIMNIKENIQKIEITLEKKRKERQSIGRQSLTSEMYTPNDRNLLKKQSQSYNYRLQQKSLTSHTDCTSKRVSSQILSISRNQPLGQKTSNFMNIATGPNPVTNLFPTNPYSSGYQFITINNEQYKTHYSYIKNRQARAQKSRMLREQETSYTNPDFLKMMQADVEAILCRRKIL